MDDEVEDDELLLGIEVGGAGGVDEEECWGEESGAEEAERRGLG